MKRFVPFTLFALVIFLLVAGVTGVKYFEDTATLANRKDKLVSEADHFGLEGNREVTAGWYALAPTYLGPEEVEAIDALWEQVKRNYQQHDDPAAHQLMDNAALVSEIWRRVHAAIRNQLRAEQGGLLPPGAVEERLWDDPAVPRLKKILAAMAGLEQAGRAAHNATSLAELDQCEADLEAHKLKLLRAFRAFPE